MPNVTKTFADAFIPEMWSEAAIEELVARTFLPELVNRDYEHLVLDMGDQVNIQTLGSFQSASKTAGTALTPAVPNTSGSVTLAIDQHIATAVQFEDIVKVQGVERTFNSYINRLVTPILYSIEDTIIAQLSSSGGNSVSASTADTISVAEIANAKNLLDAANVPQENRIMLLRNTTFNNLLANTTLSSRDFVLGNPMVDGSQGQIFGFDVFMTTRPSAGSRDMFFHRDAVTLAMQKDVQILEDFSVLDIAHQIVAHAIWGTIQLDSNKVVNYFN